MNLEFITGFDFYIIWRYLPALLRGLWTNLVLTGLGFVAGGIVLGTLLALANLSRRALIAGRHSYSSNSGRSTPLLVQAIWMHFAFPVISGLQTTPFQSASWPWFSTSPPIAARSSVPASSACPRGQFEAARALGLRPLAMWLKIILPQAVRIVVPPLIGTVISIFKATAILSVLAINDVMRAAQRVSSYTFKPIEVLYDGGSPRIHYRPCHYGCWQPSRGPIPTERALSPWTSSFGSSSKTCRCCCRDCG